MSGDKSKNPDENLPRYSGLRPSEGDDAPFLPRATPYLDAYYSAIDTHGPSFEATLWANPKWQAERFRIFTEMHNLRGKSILDAGSGKGDLAEYLRSRRIRYTRYIGLDAMPEMVDLSKSRRLPRAEFHVCDFVGERDAFERHAAEIVVISGALNTLRQEAAIATLERAWAACGEALLFNFLSDRCEPSRRGERTDPAHRFSPTDLLSWALSRTTQAALRHDYLPYGHDATILMLRA